MVRRLGDLCDGRNNNLNLIRILAAAAVLVSHAFPVSRGPGTPEPFEHLTGQSLGSLAVTVFFVISGFLIARSFDRSGRVADWAAARIMRLFPGLLVVVVLTAGLYGPLLTTLSPRAYFSDPDVYGYVWRNMALVRPQYGLPGVFRDLPLPHVINGSLWTLFYEVACYLGVLLVGLLGLLRRRGLMALAMAVFLLGCTVSFLPAIDTAMPARLWAMRNLALPFAVGTAFYVWRDEVPLGWLGLPVAFAAMLLLNEVQLQRMGVTLFLCYAVFVLAYLPGGPIHAYNRLGDYSYGIYIYAFPMQQLVMFLVAPLSPLQNMALAFPLTLVLAILSWHLVERPCLASRGRLADLLASLPSRRINA